MKLNYKKIGDTLSLDEYNALVYILEQQEWKETITLDLDEPYTGNYGTYTLYDLNHVLTEDRNGFTILKPDEPFYINIESNFSCKYKIYFDVTSTLSQTETISEGLLKGKGVQTTYEANDIKEYVPDSVSDINRTINSDMSDVDKLIPSANVIVDPNVEETVNSDILTQSLPISKGVVKDTAFKGSRTQIKVTLSDFNYFKNDFLSDTATIYLDYTQPQLNLSHGRYENTNEILCETFDELKTVIDTMPENSTVNIHLLGKTYVCTDELYIKNKTVHIIGGNLKENDFEVTGELDYTNDIRGGTLLKNAIPYTQLDAKNVCRHMYIESGSTVTVENIIFKNGNAYGDNSRQHLHHRGGSIYVGSDWELYGGDYTHLKTSFKATHCYFNGNTAEFGGAIFNHNSRVELDTCWLYQNRSVYEKYHNSNISQSEFQYRLWNLGGAIRSESVKGYNYDESYDRLHIDDSTYTTNKNNTIINLVFSDTQNTTLLAEVTLTKDNFELYDYEGRTKYHITNVKKINNLKYTITISEHFNTKHKYYFRFKGNEKHMEMLSKVFKLTSKTVSSKTVTILKQV